MFRIAKNVVVHGFGRCDELGGLAGFGGFHGLSGFHGISEFSGFSGLDRFGEFGF